MSLQVRLIFSFPHYQILAIAIVLALLGISQIVFAIVAFVQRIWGFYVGSGLWGGCFSFLAGVAGIVAANTKGVCIVKTFMVTSLLSVCVAVPLIVLSAGGLTTDSNFYWHNPLQNPQRLYTSTTLIHGFLLAFAFIQLALSVVTSVVCLKHLYWNGSAKRRRRSKHHTKLRGGTGDHIVNNRHSVTSSHAPLVSGHHSRKKHHTRRSANHRRDNHTCEVDINREIRRSHPRRHHNRSTSHNARSSNREPPPDSMEHMNSSVNDRHEVAESVQSPSNIRELRLTNTNTDHHVLPVRIDNLSCPSVPIDEDEELPPYEESLREFDGDSVFPMSISENCSERDSSSISSSNSDQSSGEDNAAVGVWDSVSQTHSKSQNPQRPEVPTSTNRDSLNLPSNSLFTLSGHSLPSSAASASSHFSNPKDNVSCNQRRQHSPPCSPVTESDPQGVLYHGFTRNLDKIENLDRGRKQRSKSFQCERAMAKENVKGSAACKLRNSSEPEENWCYDKDLVWVKDHDIEMAPLKPPRLSIVDKTDSENKRIQSIHLDNRTSWNALDRQKSDIFPKPFSASVEQGVGPIANTVTEEVKSKPLEHKSPGANLAQPLSQVDRPEDSRKMELCVRPKVLRSNVNHSGNTPQNMSSRSHFKPISGLETIPVKNAFTGNELSNFKLNDDKKRMPFPANITIDSKPKHRLSYPVYNRRCIEKNSETLVTNTSNKNKVVEKLHPLGLSKVSNTSAVGIVRKLPTEMQKSHKESELKPLISSNTDGSKDEPESSKKKVKESISISNPRGTHGNLQNHLEPLGACAAEPNLPGSNNAHNDQAIEVANGQDQAVLLPHDGQVQNQNNPQEQQIQNRRSQPIYSLLL